MITDAVHNRSVTLEGATHILIKSSSWKKNLPVHSGAEELQEKETKMSNPTPVSKPGNTENPRAFFDVEIGGEKGEEIFL